jgi:hypothetical protein
MGMYDRERYVRELIDFVHDVDGGRFTAMNTVNDPT